MTRLRIVLLAATLLPGCEFHVDYGHAVDTKELAKQAVAIMATEAVPLANVDCGESFYYRKDHDTVVCKGTVGDLTVDVPIKFSDALHFTVRPDLPGVVSIKTPAFVAFVAENYGSDVTIDCPPNELVFWTGHDTQKCKLTVEGETRDAVVRMKGTQGFLEPDRDAVLDVGFIERQLVKELRDTGGLETKVDCGKPRLRLRRPDRRLDCHFSVDGGEGHLLVASEPEGLTMVVAETAGLPHKALEAILGMLGKIPPGATWSCPEKLPIVRGQPFHCEVVFASGKRKSIEISVKADEMTYLLHPAP